MSDWRKAGPDSQLRSRWSTRTADGRSYVALLDPSDSRQPGDSIWELTQFDPEGRPIGDPGRFHSLDAVKAWVEDLR
jgi:hypothetical protein